MSRTSPRLPSSKWARRLPSRPGSRPSLTAANTLTRLATLAVSPRSSTRLRATFAIAVRIRAILIQIAQYDLVGLNWPIFFVRDPLMGPDLIRYALLLQMRHVADPGLQILRSQQRHPKTFLIDHNMWFDYMGSVPESIHAGTVRSSRYCGGERLTCCRCCSATMARPKAGPSAYCASVGWASLMYS
jgi:hypothetical protein